MTDGWAVRDLDSGKEKEADSKADAQEKQRELEQLDMDVEIVPPESASTDGGETKATDIESPDEEPIEDPTQPTAVVDESEDAPQESGDKPAPAAFGESVHQDPLDILPSYMIDTVQGTPTLNKRGISVLAHHYGVDTSDREIIVSPHESEWEYAIVETTVENADGKTFVGTGTAHVERDDDMEVLLELAETRSYKRAVSFATGTGIVSYQEMVGELE